MPIINSVIVSTSLQYDGSTLVHERHSDHTGFNHDIQYFAPAGWNIDEVMLSRAAKMGAEIDRREAQEAEANNFELPITLYEFMDRFTAIERKKIRARERTNEDIADFMDLARTRGVIYLSSPRLLEALNALVALGDIAAARRDEVLA